MKNEKKPLEQRSYSFEVRAEDHAASDAFVPYTPTLRELYEMIQALQTGGTT